MSSIKLEESRRVMNLCNACRYCEGFCAVFPAMELRRNFSDEDLSYLANLCHNCRDCYYACQYAPPHEYDINVPKTLADLRLETYQHAVGLPLFKKMLTNSGWAVSIINIVCILLVLAVTLFNQKVETILDVHKGSNSFFEVISYSTMVFPISALAVLLSIGMLINIRNFWRLIGGNFSELLNIKAHSRAISDVLKLKYLDGGGHGCNYPNEDFSMIRRNFHHATFYGFLLCFAATIVAVFYHHYLGIMSPYPFFSLPVLLGTIGGVSILIGTTGQFYLKMQMDPMPASNDTFGMDVGFIVSLFLASSTGLLLLIFRSTQLMGSLLIIHIGVVIALFITMPYGKFIHGIFRYLVLVRNAIEQSQDKT